MNAKISPSETSPDLPRTLEQQIEKRTWGRVRQLRVESDRNRIIVRGSTPSYYVKQLVVQAILESLAGEAGVPVSLDIKVGASPMTRVES
jgi:hypothetical protein